MRRANGAGRDVAADHGRSQTWRPRRLHRRRLTARGQGRVSSTSVTASRGFLALTAELTRRSVSIDVGHRVDRRGARYCRTEVSTHNDLKDSRNRFRDTANRLNICVPLSPSKSSILLETMDCYQYSLRRVKHCLVHRLATTSHYMSQIRFQPASTVLLRNKLRGAPKVNSDERQPSSFMVVLT